MPLFAASPVSNSDNWLHGLLHKVLNYPLGVRQPRPTEFGGCRRGGSDLQITANEDIRSADLGPELWVSQPTTWKFRSPVQIVMDGRLLFAPPPHPQNFLQMPPRIARPLLRSASLTDASAAAEIRSSSRQRPSEIGRPLQSGVGRSQHPRSSGVVDLMLNSQTKSLSPPGSSRIDAPGNCDTSCTGTAS